MLDPHDRRLLLDSMRPPIGYGLDRAIGTTFTLDLLALLTTPLGFTLFDFEDEEGRLRPDPMALLEALRRYADRVAIFCHAGQIAVPRKAERLFEFLEGSVFEVAPERGLFHPKVWVLRFVSPDRPVRYRLLCTSRNLTFDRSWDTILALDGEVVDRKLAFAANHPLADFVKALPGLARGVSDAVRRDVDIAQAELRRVGWELPEGFDGVRFWPLGIDGYDAFPFEGRVDRLLVLSPFLSDGAVTKLGSRGEGNVLVSRLETLQALDPASLRGFARVFYLNPSAEPAELDDDEETRSAIRGLHAKLYVAERGWDAHVWTGSANATDAAFGDSIEFLVEIAGKKSRVGIDTLLEHADGRTTLGGMLQAFIPSEQRKEEEEPGAAKIEMARAAMARARLAARVESIEGEACTLVLRVADGHVPSLPEGVRVSCWPITLRAGERTVERGADPLAEFALAVESLTSFFAFEVAAPGEAARPITFVLNVPLEGAPADRPQRLLRSLLRDRSHVIRFLLFLLSEDALATSDGSVGGPRAEGASGSASAFFAGSTLFEALVRALDRNPSRLDQVERIVRDLRSSPELEASLPEGFLGIWEPIWAARQRLKR